MSLGGVVVRAASRECSLNPPKGAPLTPPKGAHPYLLGSIHFQELQREEQCKKSFHLNPLPQVLG